MPIQNPRWICQVKDFSRDVYLRKRPTFIVLRWVNCVPFRFYVKQISCHSDRFSAQECVNFSTQLSKWQVFDVFDLISRKIRFWFHDHNAVRLEFVLCFHFFCRFSWILPKSDPSQTRDHRLHGFHEIFCAWTSWLKTLMSSWYFSDFGARLVVKKSNANVEKVW